MQASCRTVADSSGKGACEAHFLSLQLSGRHGHDATLLKCPRCDRKNGPRTCETDATRPLTSECLKSSIVSPKSASTIACPPDSTAAPASSDSNQRFSRFDRLL